MMISPEATIELMRRASCAGSDGEALADAYDLYGKGMIAYARAMIGSADDAEDAVQEVFVRLARNAKNLHRIKDLRKYLFRATRNEVYELLRGKMRRQRLEDGVARSIEETVVGSPSDEAAAVMEGFSELPADQREVLALKVFQGLTFREIGQIIGKSQNTVSSRYRYAVERLRKTVGSDESGH
jgi:RNA polymerase sigma-70 factor, ECF subfamily